MLKAYGHIINMLPKWGGSSLKGNFAIFYMLAKYVPGDIKYIFTNLHFNL